jgi:hypothetical protein
LPFVLEQGFDARPLVARWLLDPLRRIQIEHPELGIERACQRELAAGNARVFREG